MDVLHRNNQFLPRIFLASLLVFAISSLAVEAAEPTDPAGNTTETPADKAPDKAEKKCLTVCERWGEDCIISGGGVSMSPRGTAVAKPMQRKCRRVCKELGQECFDPAMPKLSP
ncbi:MAG: hypothetical protein A2W28_10895 [Gammaproteobacteria bacterium RBG_16_51_14]|nr:MAG: hypothetical protein A2W28_10895 [Gammaproteobacteria bacterium RBG_16_51_14]